MANLNEMIAKLPLSDAMKAALLKDTDDNKAKVLKGFGIKVDKPLFEKFIYNAPDGKAIEMVMVNATTTSSKGKAVERSKAIPVWAFEAIVMNAEEGAKFLDTLEASN